MRPAAECRQFYEFVATHLEKVIGSARMRQLAVEKARDLAVLDLGDAGLGDAEGVCEFGLGEPGGGAHLGELVPADVCFPVLAGRGPARGLLPGRPRVGCPAPCLDLVPPGVAGAHGFPVPSSWSSSARCLANRSSASGIAWRYQRSQLPALTPGDEEDRLAPGVKREQQPDLRRSR